MYIGICWYIHVYTGLNVVSAGIQPSQAFLYFCAPGYCTHTLCSVATCTVNPPECAQCLVQSIPFGRKNLLYTHCTAGKGFAGVVYPTLCWSGREIPHPDEYILPLVILWNPAISLPNIFPDQSIICPECDLPAPCVYWNDGSMACRQPRILHSMDDMVYLVSSIHSCANGHRTLSHDERILTSLPKWIVIPFILFHKSGVTLDLLNSCNAMCKQGVNMHTVESIVADRRWIFFCQRKEKYHYAVQEYQSHHPLDEVPDFPDFETLGMNHLPSNDLICRCFLTDFLENERFYLQDIQQSTASKYISLDHTFRVASNIGYMRKDKKWVSLYNSLFMVLNEEGKILTWQLTNSTSFAHIEGLVLSLQQRFKEGGANVEFIAIDNCCQWRNKLERVFGSHDKIVLDVFHAVQRVTRKIPKRHPFHYQCQQALRLVFRESGDHGRLRQKCTPQPAEMWTIYTTVDKCTCRWLACASYWSSTWNK